ncbi:MAG: amidohydrolase family protein [Planctomycetes bacterium]|nr:amidohydrolase family protein [Planctomycetota bacterium]
MPFDSLTYAWNHSELLRPALEGRFAADSHSGWSRLDTSFDHLTEAVKPLTGAIVCGIHSEILGVRVPHADIAQAVAQDPFRLIGFAGIDPLSGDWIKQLAAARKLSLHGVCVCPAAQGVHPTHPEAMKLWAKCEAEGRPVISLPLGSASGSTPIEFGHPTAWDEPARQFPKLKIVIGGFGWPWIDECLAMLVRHPQLFTETSLLVRRPWRLLPTLADAESLGVLEQVLPGSGFPFLSPSAALQTILTVNRWANEAGPRLSPASLRGITERNIFKTLGVNPPLLAPKDLASDIPETLL